MEFIQIPKNGTTTLHAMKGGEKPPHNPASTLEASKVVALIRDPVDRLVSALNHVDSQDPIERVLQQAFRKGCQKVFLPQSHFVNRQAYLWPFEKMAEAYAWAGVEGDLAHENKGRTRYTKDDVEPFMANIRAFYAKDFVLREAALENPGELHDAQGQLVHGRRETDLPQADGPKPGTKKRGRPKGSRNKRTG